MNKNKSCTKGYLLPGQTKLATLGTTPKTTGSHWVWRSVLHQQVVSEPAAGKCSPYLEWCKGNRWITIRKFQTCFETKGDWMNTWNTSFNLPFHAKAFFGFLNLHKPFIIHEKAALRSVRICSLAQHWMCCWSVWTHAAPVLPSVWVHAPGCSWPCNLGGSSILICWSRSSWRFLSIGKLKKVRGNSPLYFISGKSMLVKGVKYSKIWRLPVRMNEMQPISVLWMFFVLRIP